MRSEKGPTDNSPGPSTPQTPQTQTGSHVDARDQSRATCAHGGEEVPAPLLDFSPTTSLCTGNRGTKALISGGAGV